MSQQNHLSFRVFDSRSRFGKNNLIKFDQICIADNETVQSLILRLELNGYRVDQMRYRGVPLNDEDRLDHFLAESPDPMRFTVHLRG